MLAVVKPSRPMLYQYQGNFNLTVHTAIALGFPRQITTPPRFTAITSSVQPADSKYSNNCMNALLESDANSESDAYSSSLGNSEVPEGKASDNKLPTITRR